MHLAAAPFGALLLAASPSPAPTSPGAPVILFLVDNSASLPPLDPEEKRVAALEKMFSVLQGQTYRLVLFGGRREVYVDDVVQYNNRGQWTDFYFAFEKARDLVKEYPPATEFRLILVTDAMLDPSPADWQDMGVPPGEDLKEHVRRRCLELLRELKRPLYVILIGTPPAEAPAGDVEQTPALILDMVQAANGLAASPTAQSLSSFFKDDGMLLKKFVFRVAPHEGLQKVQPVVRRIVAPSSSSVELQILAGVVLPLVLLLFVLLGLLVRSFPGPGDTEVVELYEGVPVHVAADRLHRVTSGGWATTGLSVVPDAKQAAATFVHQRPALDLAGVGVDTSDLDSHALKLLPQGLDEMRRSLEAYASAGSKEEKIFALNLDYMAKNFEPKQAERILAAGTLERRKVAALDFLRAKAHLLSNDALRRRLTDPRVVVSIYGKRAERKELEPGAAVRIGRYRFIVKDVGRGRRDVKVVLYYDRVPSLLGLKTVLPDVFQRLFRFRRSSQRVVA